jgi:two-component system nitrate/nitrite response regulator NarL
MARAIRERPEFELVAECVDGDEAISEIAAHEPHVALVDLQLPGRSGLDIVRSSSASGSATRVVILSAHIDSAFVYEAVAARAAGYLSKDADRRAICDAIAAVARGDTAFAEDLRGGLIKEIQARASVNEAPRLTARERDVLGLVADGLSTRRIAERLYLSQTTIKGYLKTVYEKLGVSDRAAAVAEALRRGLLQ